MPGNRIKCRYCSTLMEYEIKIVKHYKKTFDSNPYRKRKEQVPTSKEVKNLNTQICPNCGTVYHKGLGWVDWMKGKN